MKVLVAGATGAIGRPLIPKLLDAGHDVVGTTRSETKADSLRAAGAEAVVVDVRDTEALRRAVEQAEPEVIVNQLTSLPERMDFRDAEALEVTNALRRDVGPALARVAADVGVKRLIAQSVAFFYAAKGDPVKSEDDELMELPPESPMAGAPLALRELERSTLERPGVDGLVLRYGYFYGPGTYYGPDGSTAEQVLKRRFPVVGSGLGVFSFIHVDDAASATLAAVERGAPGVYNVTDDDPAPMRDWLPAYAEALGAKRPRKVPAFVARMVAGREVVALATAARGADNSKAKRELQWEPRYSSWRQGFDEALA